MNCNNFLIDLNKFINKINRTSKSSKGICVNMLVDEILDFTNEDKMPVELSKIRIAFNELLISIIDPEKADLLDQNNYRASDDDF
ncbi:MAG: hypothetical protein AMJ43_04425 [Coxiella sp. DG_40]|nr:MAG: hypothetical protein AMJ43_04425 [Coxiella sp. DG_40]